MGNFRCAVGAAAMIADHWRRVNTDDLADLLRRYECGLHPKDAWQDDPDATSVWRARERSGLRKA